MTNKYYKYSIVFHNTRPGSKDKIVAAFKAIPKFKELKSGEEKYCDEDGEPLPGRPDRHVHVFVEFYNQRHFHSILKRCESIKKPHVWPEQLVDGDWGRVQVDQGRGTMEECLDYLEGATKHKHTDDEVTSETASPPGYYKCYKCRGDFHGLNMTISHQAMTGVCRTCYWAHKNTYSGEWEYFPAIGRSEYIYSDLQAMRNPSRELKSQPILPNAFLFPSPKND